VSSNSGSTKSGSDSNDRNDSVAIDLVPSCKAAARLMSESRDRTLSDEEEQSLNKHLSICKNCMRFDKQLDFLAELARRYAKGSAAEG
jgi:Putative zinc-finger